MKATRLRTAYMRSPIGMDFQHPVLSWCCEEGVSQTAFQIVAMSDEKETWDSGIRKSDRMQWLYEPQLHSRERITWKVRLWDENGEAGAWSEEASFELGITDPGQWNAQWIDPEPEQLDVASGDAINQKAKEAWEQGKKKEPFSPHLPASYLRKVFTAVPGKRNRLYITCKGIYRAYLNGKPVGSQVLSPGPAVYDQYIPVQTYDVDGLLQEGENELLVILGDGW